MKLRGCLGMGVASGWPSSGINARCGGMLRYAVAARRDKMTRILRSPQSHQCGSHTYAHLWRGCGVYQSHGWHRGVSWGGMGNPSSDTPEHLHDLTATKHFPCHRPMVNRCRWLQVSCEHALVVPAISGTQLPANCGYGGDFLVDPAPLQVV